MGEHLSKFKALNCTCKDAASLLSDQTERRLSRWERAGLSLHLILCRACRTYRHNLNFLSQTMKQSVNDGAAPPDENLTPDAKERIRQRMGT